MALQVGFFVVEVGFLTSKSFPALMAIFAVGELALFAGQAPCCEGPHPAAVPWSSVTALPLL